MSQSPITISFQLNTDPVSLLTALQNIAVWLGGGGTMLAEIKEQLMTQNESIKALSDAFDAFKTKVAGALTNLSADIKGLQDQLATLGDLTPANQAVVDAVIAGMGQAATDVQAEADIVPDVPPAA